MDKWAIAIFSLVGVVLGAALQFLLSRNIEREKHATDLRSKAYADYLRAVAATAHLRSDEDLRDAHRDAADAKARIAVYGSTSVIVEAHRVERGQEWIGLTFGNSAVWPPFLVQLHGTAIIEYTPPMKEEASKYASPIVLDWPRRWRDRHGGQCPSSKLQELNTKPKFSQKWTNTIEFAEFSLRKHDWHLRPHEIPKDAVLKLVSRQDADFG